MMHHHGGNCHFAFVIKVLSTLNFLCRKQAMSASVEWAPTARITDAKLHRMTLLSFWSFALLFRMMFVVLLLVPLRKFNWTENSNVRTPGTRSCLLVLGMRSNEMLPTAKTGDRNPSECQSH